MTDFRANEIAFERAARDYYLAVTGRANWSDIPPRDRARFRSQLEQAARRFDAELNQMAARELRIDRMIQQSPGPWRF